MAVPYKGIYYAWGEKVHIEEICKKRLKNVIDLTPLDIDAVMEIGVFKELLLKTVVSKIARRSYKKEY